MKPDPSKISIADFTYPLPAENIAEFPLTERDQSRLLIYQDGEIREDHYSHIAEYIPREALMVFNDTKVVEARLLFQKETGGQIEIFCLEPDERHGDISLAMQTTGSVFWKCLIGGASKWKPGQVLRKKLRITDTDITLEAHYREKKGDHFLIELIWNSEQFSFAEILHAAGSIPLPPYIKRAVRVEDAEQYQTIYAHYDGSVAAPTAGLHFTPAILKSLEERKIKTDFITLHVGAGTFMPVKSATIADHAMHSEFIHVNYKTVENILENHKYIITAVGTTSLRTIESLYWLGVKTKLNPFIHPASLTLGQWEAYALEKDSMTVPVALQALLTWLKRNEKEELITRTQLMIVPGYKFRIVEVLVTNFHQPQSTLLLLVAAAIGPDWKKVYEYALKKNFRFLSYGDGSLLYVRREV
ncbi:MAG: S-adenosylmethionine:tRNA ribosyltransferase-isomerase [Chitinophagales bacterium]|nr:S-adenosylmethionine:tRNA ribosyltransferase-isomerase [Chitinophagales bacterium]